MPAERTAHSRGATDPLLCGIARRVRYRLSYGLVGRRRLGTTESPAIRRDRHWSLDRDNNVEAELARRAMTALPTAKECPSLVEFVGWYNLGYDREDGWPVLNTAPDILPFEHAEIFELYPRFARWFERLSPELPERPLDPLEEPPLFVRSDADDRTLIVDVNFELLTLDRVERIKSELLARYPLWRVLLCGSGPDFAIIAYPNAIRFGSRPIGVDPERALAEMAALEPIVREALRRPRRSHFKQMQRLAKLGAAAIGDRPFISAACSTTTRATTTG